MKVVLRVQFDDEVLFIRCQHSTYCWSFFFLLKNVLRNSFLLNKASNATSKNKTKKKTENKNIKKYNHRNASPLPKTVTQLWQKCLVATSKEVCGCTRNCYCVEFCISIVHCCLNANSTEDWLTIILTSANVKYNVI